MKIVEKKNVLGIATQLEEKKILICFPQSFNCVQVKFLITPNTLKKKLHCLAKCQSVEHYLADM
jgi:hypothetical protein